MSMMCLTSLKEHLDYIWFIFTSILFYCEDLSKRTWMWLWSVARLREVVMESTRSLCKCVWTGLSARQSLSIETFCKLPLRNAGHFCSMQKLTSFSVKSPRHLGDVRWSLCIPSHISVSVHKTWAYKDYISSIKTRSKMSLTLSLKTCPQQTHLDY